MIKLFRVPISITSKSQALATVSQWLTELKVKGQQVSRSKNVKPDSLLTFQPATFFLRIITTPNPEMIVAAQIDPEFLKALQSADLAIPDGIGIVWAVRMLNDELRMTNVKKQTGIQHSTFNIIHSTFVRLSGLDLMESLIGESAKKGWKVMLLGGRSGIAEKAAKKLMHQIRPGLASQGRAFIQSINGPKDISIISVSDNDSLITRINSYSPDLLFVAFGHGKQEKWLTANRRRLNAGVAMGVGGALDQIADPSLRPPVYINSIGLGWLYRLLREPRRWKRQLALVKFAGMVVREKIAKFLISN